MNPIIQPPAIGKIVGQTKLFNLCMGKGLGKVKLKLKPVKFH